MKSLDEIHTFIFSMMSSLHIFNFLTPFGWEGEEHNIVLQISSSLASFDMWKIFCKKFSNSCACMLVADANNDILCMRLRLGQG